MNNADKPAYPLVDADGVKYKDGEGLTKRERFAMAAMQGMLGMEHLNQQFRGSEFSQNGIPTEAVKMADKVLKQLEETQ